MSQIHIEPDEFSDIVLLYLFDSLRDDEGFIKSELFKDFLEFAEQRGAKAKLFGMYMKMNSDTRIRYKKVSNVFRGGDTARINIGQAKVIKEETEFDRELCKKIFRKIKDVRFKTSKPITEERLDKIIDYCIKQQEETKNG